MNDQYITKVEACLKRGVKVGDILICDNGAQPVIHQMTKRPCVRISYCCMVEDGVDPRFFVHGASRGLVAYVEDKPIVPGTKFKVTRHNGASVNLEQI